MFYCELTDMLSGRSTCQFFVASFLWMDGELMRGAAAALSSCKSAEAEVY